MFQSVVDQYLAPADRAGVHDALVAAGARATPDRPLAWLRLEPDPDPGTPFGIDLTTWPGPVERRLGTSGAHGTGVTIDRLFA